MANKRNRLGMLVMVLVFGMSVVGCDNSTTNGNKVPQFVDVDLFTLEGSILNPYSGKGTSQAVIGWLSSDDEDSNLLGEIGSISADGKLTLELPDTVNENLLFPGGLIKYAYLNTDPYLRLYNKDNTAITLVIAYYTQGFSNYGATVKKGWNFIIGEGSPPAIITDFSNYSWVIED